MEPKRNAEPRVSLLRSFLGTFGVLVCHLVAVAALVLIFASLAPRYIAIVADRDAELPAFTIMFINLANWLTDYWYVLVLLLVPDGLTYFGLSRLPWKWNWLATAWAMIWLLATIGLLFMAIVAIYLPVESLMTVPKGS